MKKWLFIASVLIIFLCVFFLYSLKPESNKTQKMINHKSIVVWGYSPGLMDIANRFEKKYPDVKVVTRLVKNSHALLEELYAAHSAGNPPDFAEMPSWYGIYPFIEAGGIGPVDSLLSEEFEAQLPGAIARRFSFEAQLWAIPISYEVPVLYINEAKVGEAKIDLTDGQQINADNRYPWYLLSLSEEQNASELVQTYRNFLFHKNHLALTDFVNGEGTVLISSSEKIQLIEKLIGSKFKWGLQPFPISSESWIPNGNGLVVFGKGEGLPAHLEQFVKFVQEDEQLVKFAISNSVIPASKKLVRDQKFQEHYRHFPSYQQVMLDSLEANGQYLKPEDEHEWNVIISENDRFN